MSKLFFDHRWCARHGIGRFATEVRARLSAWTDLPCEGRPASALDGWRLARALRQQPCEGYFSPGYNVPWQSPCPFVCTVHDLIHLYDPRSTSFVKQCYYRWIHRPMVRSAPVTLTVSEYSRQQIIHYYDLDPVKVVNVGNGVSEAFLANGPAHQSIRPYFLYVGADRPHKNIELALRALKKVRGELDLAMICASNDRLVLQDRIDRLGLSADVQVVSNLDDEALARLYRGAIALILPSNYEGFGLPLVEALASGCEVIASNCTSIPEVLAGHGRLFEPNSLDELTQAMLTVASKSVRDESLSVKRRDRAADFNWDRVAERICLALANVFPVTAPAMRAGT